MINGRPGRETTLILALMLMVAVLIRVALLLAGATGAAMSLDNLISLVTGLFIGSVGINPYVNARPPTLYDPDATSEIEKRTKQ